MRVIRTDLRRRAARFVFRAAAFAAVPAAVLTAFFLSPQLREAVGVAAAVDSSSSFTSIENANGIGCMLYEPTEPEEERSAVRAENDDIPMFSPDEMQEFSASAESSGDEDDSGEAAAEAGLSSDDQSSVKEGAVTSALLLTANMSDAREDLGVFSEHSGRIYEEHFGKGSGPEFINLSGGGQLRNCTDFSADWAQEQASIPSGVHIEQHTSEPQVLILHTHTTESYEPYEKDWYDASYTSRSEDPANSVVSVGTAIAEQLAAAGIGVIHDCTVHDSPYTGAYVRSLDTAKKLLEAYPSIKVVLDIHRDAIGYEDGSRVSAVAEIDGRKAAQIMVVCAADDGSDFVPGFRENLHFACALQQQTETMFPGLTRPILFQYCQYNQQVSPGALLIEVGSHGNTVEQAVYSGELIGRSLAAMLNETAEPLAVPALAPVPLYFLDRVR